jgi:hypothetical protein
MRGSSKIFLSLAATFLIFISGIIVFYKPSTRADILNEENLPMHAYDVEWMVKKSLLPSISDFVSKNTGYKKTVSFETPNLKDIIFQLRWIDDTSSFFGFFGRDTLTLSVTTPDGTSFTKSARSERITKQGHIEISVLVNTSMPRPVKVLSTSILGAGQQLRGSSFDYTWADKEFIVEVSDRIGEFRFLKRWRDAGNDFDLNITSEYYRASIAEDESFSVTNGISEGTVKETSLIPPSMCPFCEGEFHHEIWCPYYEDSFEDNLFDDDPFEDDQWDNNWDNNHGNTYGVHVDTPGQLIFMYVLFLLMVFFSKMWVFGGIL